MNTNDSYTQPYSIMQELISDCFFYLKYRLGKGNCSVHGLIECNNGK